MAKESLSQMQKRIDAILQGYEMPYWSPLSQFARLAEEVGELGKVLNHMHGDKPKKATDHDDLEDEMADVLWTLICLANSQGISLENGIERAVEKLLVRDKDRFKKKTV